MFLQTVKMMPHSDTVSALMTGWFLSMDTPACLAYFTLWTLPSCPLDGRGTNLQAGRMIMLATTRTEQ